MKKIKSKNFISYHSKIYFYKKSIQRSVFLFLIIILTLHQSFSQQEKQKKYSIDGYITNMQSVMFTDSISGNWTNDNLIHNRLNFKWFPSQNFTLKIGLRTRFISGETVKYSPNYASNIEKDNGIIDLNWNVFSEQSFLLNSQIDRANISYEKENLNITLGRQRINWGRSFVWNPNDIFNSYSFFDFDYPEKPGSDALRIQYYTGAISSAELVVKADSSKKITSAILYKFPIKNYDVQFMGGIINEQDYVIGAGWEGEIKSVSFKGEATYLQPKNNFKDTTGLFVACASASYGFSNSAFLQFEFLYNQQSKNSDLTSYLNQTLTVKNLSFTEYNLFGSITYPVTSLLNATLSAMYYPQVNGFYIGPSITYSLSDNLNFAVIAQSFQIKDYTNPVTQGKGLKMSFAFIQLKYYF